MDKVDRLGWAEGMAFKAFGVRIGIRVSERGFIKRIKNVLPLGWESLATPKVEHLFSLRIGGRRPQSKIRRYHILYLESVRLSRTMDLDEALQTLETNLHFIVSLEAPRKLFIHAGVVAWKNRAILIPGPSFSGKSTLVSELVRAGATYYSDEYAVLDGRGRVHAYPRPLVKRSGKPRNGIVRPRRKKLKPLPVGTVLVTRYKDGATWRPRALTPAEAALELLANTVAARPRPQFAMETIKKALQRARALKSKRGDAAQVVGALQDSLDAE
jgi:hypothetical protein